MSTLIKKHMTLPFLNVGTADAPQWVQIKKATEFAHSLNPETEERDYIADEQPTTELKQYKPSMSLSVTTLAGESDFDLFYDLYKNKRIGEDAKMEYLLVYVFDSVKAGGTTYYYAYKAEATVAVSEFNTVDSTIAVEIHENGTPTHGFVTLEDGAPTFTEGDMPEAEETEAEDEESSSAPVQVQDAYGTYTVSDSIKAAVQENYLSKLASDYGLEYDGELTSFELEIAAAQKITATLKFACGAETAHWPTIATLSLPGKYTFVAGKDEGRISAIKWDYSSLEHAAAYTGAHNTGEGTGHAEDETTHAANEAAAIRDADAQLGRTLAREVASAYLAAPLIFAGDVLTNEAGEEVATK